MSLFFFFFNDTATTEIYTLSLHDALPISCFHGAASAAPAGRSGIMLPEVSLGLWQNFGDTKPLEDQRSEEHTSELQSRLHLVCRLLLEKKKRIFPSIFLRPSRQLLRSVKC